MARHKRWNARAYAYQRRRCAGKIAYDQAWAAHVARVTVEDADQVPVFVYECLWGRHWHLTHHDPWTPLWTAWTAFQQRRPVWKGRSGPYMSSLAEVGPRGA